MWTRVGILIATLAVFALATPLATLQAQSEPDLPAKLWKITVDLSRQDPEFGIQSGTADFHRDGIVLVTLDAGGSKIPGVWRLKDRNQGLSSTFELQCEKEEPCGTLILRGNPERSGGLDRKSVV